MTKTEDRGMPRKTPDKVAAVTKRPTKKKAKDKPKRPLSAYNFFFKEEREKILKVVMSDESTDAINEPKSVDYIDERTLGRLRKEGGKVSFEEMGKLIGQRWKNLEPDSLTKYSALAAEDTERYKKAMQTYNGQQEAKMRNDALKPPDCVNHYTDGEGKPLPNTSGVQRPGEPLSSSYDMGAHVPYSSAASQAGHYAYGMEYAGYGQPIYGYGGYTAGAEYPNPIMYQEHPGMDYVRGISTGFNGSIGYNGGTNFTNGQHGVSPQYQSQMPPGLDYPQGAGTYGYGPGHNWGGQQG